MQGTPFCCYDFKVPNRQKLGKELLDINFNSCCESNIKELMKEGFVFGSTFVGDGATIGRMPLVNILEIVAEVPPVVIAIDDCTGKYSLFPQHVGSLTHCINSYTVNERLNLWYVLRGLVASSLVTTTTTTTTRFLWRVSSS